uniref:SOCS box domain-containing protein n=1 Tax=Strigamia maritima TaxID=126957 RepID=T1INI6_STRMM
MSVCWSSFRFVNKLKQPYRCIVKCGSNVFKVSIAFAILGFIFLYFFWFELHGDSLWKRALAITGIVLSSISFVLLLFSCTICVFYIRLYKVHEGSLNEISIDGEKEKSVSERREQHLVNGNLSTRSKLPIWNTGNNTNLYAPSAPPLNRLTPPLESYNHIPDWSSSGPNIKSLSMDREVVVGDLHQALRSRNLHTIQQVLSAGINVNVPLRGTTPLSLAIHTNAESATKLLLTHGADVNQMSRDHLDRLEPPLYTACRLGHESIVQILVQNDADVNKPDWYGQTSLWVAVRERRLDLVQLLLENGAKLGRVTSWSDCPLYLATKYLYFGRREIAILLVISGCDADFADGERRNSLFWALKNGDRELAYLLVMAGGRPRVGWDWGLLGAAVGQDDDFLCWMRKEMSSPPSLKRLSRLCIRKRILLLNCGVVSKFVNRLDLPRSIKEYLNLDRN